MPSVFAAFGAFELPRRIAVAGEDVVRGPGDAVLAGAALALVGASVRSVRSRFS